MNHPTRYWLRLRTAFAGLLAATLLSGCIGAKAPATRFYILTPAEEGAAPLSERPLVVEIASLRLPQYLERPQIVTREQRNRLELAEYHQWAGNLRKNMARVLAANLSHELATPNVAIAPHPSSTPPDVRIDLEVMQFERSPDQRVHLSANWSLSHERGREVLASRHTRLSSEPLPVSEEADYDATVAAMNGVLGELSAEIAEAIRQQPRAER